MLIICSEWHWSHWLAIVLHVCLVLPCFRAAMVPGKNPLNINAPALFAFGDSIVDSGNNNYIPLTLIKCNFPPNGKDFEGSKATGRFCNGRLPTDFMVEKLGIKKTLPAYLDSSITEEDLLTGVSFASAGSGYDRETASLVLTRPLEDQFYWFTEYVEKIKAITGAERTNFIVNNSLFFVVTGSCDLANTYFTVPFRRLFQDVDSFTDVMLEGAITFVKNLYEMGARTIALANVPPLGYLPSQRTLGGGLFRKCPKYYNDAVQVFNGKLEAGLKDLNSKLPDANLLYLDVYSIFLDLVLNNTKYGFKVVDRGCCGSGLIEAGPLCNSFSLLCNSKYLFWDSFHPSEAAYELLVDQVLEKYFPHLT